MIALRMLTSDMEVHRDKPYLIRTKDSYFVGYLLNRKERGPFYLYNDDLIFACGDEMACLSEICEIAEIT